MDWDGFRQRIDEALAGNARVMEPIIRSAEGEDEEDGNELELREQVP